MSLGGPLFRGIHPSLMGLAAHPGGDPVHIGMLPQEDGSRLSGYPTPTEAASHRNSPFHNPENFSTQHLRNSRLMSNANMPAPSGHASCSSNCGSCGGGCGGAAGVPGSKTQGVSTLLWIAGIFAIVKLMSAK